MGLLADVIALLKNNGCEVRSAAVWTHHHRCAFVISVLEGAPGLPIRDGIKLARLRQLLLAMMDPQGAADSVVSVTSTKGVIHYERRLHQLLLREEEATWRRQTGLAAQYEQDIAEQQAQLERRFGGGAASASAGAASMPGSVGGAPSSSATTTSSTRTASGSGARSLQSSASAPAGALSPPSGVLSSTLSATPATAEAAAAAVVAAAAAANVAVSAGSPTMGSPDGSAHGSGAAGAGEANASASGSAACNTSTLEASAVASEGSEPPSIAAASARPPPGSRPPLLDVNGGRSTVKNGGGKTESLASSADCLSGQGAGGASSGSVSGSTLYDFPAAVSTASSPRSSMPAATLAPPPSPPPPLAPPASSTSPAQKPEVWVQHSKQHNYWTVNIRCRDRQKLLFDTVCTLADLNYDVYHGAVDCEVERDKAGVRTSIAVQTFYMRPRYGDSFWDPKKAAKLKYMLETAIQRRQPQGTKVHIHGVPSGPGSTGGAGDLPSLTAVWRDFGLCISRAKVRALGGSAGEHTFYLVDHNGRPPADTVVQSACQQIGGVRVARPDGAGGTPPGGGAVVPGTVAAAAAAARAAAAAGAGAVRSEAARFGFTVYSRPGWSVGSRGSPASSVADSI
ncbi:hypothetical protein Agub_g13173 [Astrephomene gubernaculifera]|uniref:Uncharacterized protein n=1 Tax=Astrephomene gubernaculifera TaxID=47775 RepID=A0AAD3HRX1_9CHLO|nr:hypothetical protein Agub_g13173 [Astrephomene gubernaculifera]